MKKEFVMPYMIAKKNGYGCIIRGYEDLPNLKIWECGCAGFNTSVFDMII